VDGHERPEPYATWGERFQAWLLDILAIYSVLIVLALLLYLVIGPDDDPNTDDPAGYGALAGIAGFVIMPFYFGILQGGARGQSVGKRTVGIAVRRVDPVDRLGYRRSFARSFVMLGFWILSPVWLLDYLWPIWDRQRQALHDKVVASIVIRTASE
jgi:uncharacterized RDD family membrane protein YckC